MIERETYKNMILIAGDGRNVGKTYLACSIIQAFSESHRIIGIKSSPHLHELPKDALIVSKGKGFIVTLENRLSGKDSSLMLQNGASKVFFIMSEKEKIKSAFESIREHVNKDLVVAESGGLHEIIDPGLFLFIKKQGQDIVKKQYLNYLPKVISSKGSSFSPNPLQEVEEFIKSNCNIHV